MAGRAGLVAKKLTDKRGHTSTHWVKPGGGGHAAHHRLADESHPATAANSGWGHKLLKAAGYGALAVGSAVALGVLSGGGKAIGKHLGNKIGETIIRGNQMRSQPPSASFASGVAGRPSPHAHMQFHSNGNVSVYNWGAGG
jgi:hypothetical protein